MVDVGSCSCCCWSSRVEARSRWKEREEVNEEEGEDRRQAREDETDREVGKRKLDICTGTRRRTATRMRRRAGGGLGLVMLNGTKRWAVGGVVDACGGEESVRGRHVWNAKDGLVVACILG